MIPPGAKRSSSYRISAPSDLIGQNPERNLIRREQRFLVLAGEVDMVTERLAGSLRAAIKHFKLFGR